MYHIIVVSGNNIDTRYMFITFSVFLGKYIFFKYKVGKNLSASLNFLTLWLFFCRRKSFLFFRRKNDEIRKRHSSHRSDMISTFSLKLSADCGPENTVVCLHYPSNVLLTPRCQLYYYSTVCRLKTTTTARTS